ncbi:roadblock/LC7 domain-containing protein [Streptomyces sp. NPDC026665]|uniref:roadblock/LC7 domain-containing protein n=1 Tax=Streptomyces sp. NPDC026665 TaxID=3154798 RepID=UPI0033E90087
MSSTAHPDPLVDLLTALREQVMGVQETVLSTADGLLVAADADTVHPESVAALSAATLSLGQRLTDEAKGGVLRDITTRSTERHILIQSVGERALLTVVGDSGLDFAALQSRIHGTVEQLLKIIEKDVPA